MPYLRCISCGVLTYAPRGAWQPRCAGCGLPLRSSTPGTIGPQDHERRLAELLRLTRELLDTEAALLTQIRNGREILRLFEGDWTGLDAPGGVSAPLEDTICVRMLDGRIGNYVRDTQADERVRDVAMVRELGIRAWLGVPVEAAGLLYVLCCLARDTRPSIGEREVKLLLGLAESFRAELSHAR